MTERELTPEILMAYVDGELDTAQGREVETLLATDPAARELVARFRRSAEILEQGLDQVLEQPVPQRLLNAARGDGGDVVALQPRTRPREGLGWLGLATAASVLLIVGVTAGAFLFGGNSGVMMAATDPLQQALELRPSGSPWVAEQAGARVTPLLSFRAADGRPCREFERETGTTDSFGIACRDAQGRWVAQIELQRMLLPDAAPGEHYRPAAGGADPLSEVLDRLGAGAALTVDEETRLLGSGWD